jgi:hypothetical protein
MDRSWRASANVHLQRIRHLPLDSILAKSHRRDPRSRLAVIRAPGWHLVGVVSLVAVSAFASVACAQALEGAAETDAASRPKIIEDVRAPWKTVITPVDENPLDLRQAFKP